MKMVFWGFRGCYLGGEAAKIARYKALPTKPSVKRGNCVQNRIMVIVITLLTMTLSSVGKANGQQTENSAFAVTGDLHGGVPVISGLDVSKLQVGRHHFYFQAGRTSSGQPLLVPVIVIRGALPGKRLSLTAAVHGDELNGIAVIHRLLETIEADNLTGTILALPGVNQTGLVANSRHFWSSGGGGTQTDPNRIFPGTLTGGGTAERFVGAVWHSILRNNVDIAVDLHTQTTGSKYPLFVFADFRNAKAKDIAFALMPDLIKDDSGQEGTLETTFLKAAIPAVTFEVGGPKMFQDGMVARAVEGLKNMMVAEGMVEGERRSPAVAPFVGSRYTNIEAEEAGTAVLKVKLLDSVEKGQLIAVTLDPFGGEIRRYFAPHDGRVLAVATDPLREAGAMLVRILR